MNKLFLFSLTLVLFSCSNSGEKLYESNMNFHKEMIAEINDFYENSETTDLDIRTYFEEDFTFYSFSAGSPKGATSNFEDYQNGIFTSLKQNGYKINFGHSIYLPENRIIQIENLDCIAPWVEIKYSKIESPSRKFVVIGFSIIDSP